MGWHLSYFASTATILQKLRTFSHANDRKILNITGRATEEEAHAEIERRVSLCMDNFGKLKGMSRFDANVLPTLHGWPRNPTQPNYTARGRP